MAVEGVELGPAVMPGEVSVVPEAYVVLRGDTEAEVAVLDSHLRFTRSIAGRGGRAQALVAHRASGKMFMSDDAGICELPFAGGPPARFDGSSACMRALETNRSATELVAHSKALGLCRFDLQRRELTAQVKLHVHTDRLEADLDHEMVVLPQTRQVLNLAGRVQAISPVEFTTAAIRRTDGMLAMAARPFGLWVWDWREGTPIEVDREGSAASWAADGRSLYYVRGSNELWRRFESGKTELLVRWPHLDGSQPGGMVPAPRVSASGQFVVGFLTRRGPEPEDESVTAVFEPETGRVTLVSGAYHAPLLAL